MKTVLVLMVASLLSAFSLDRNKTDDRTDNMPSGGEYAIEGDCEPTATIKEGFDELTGYERTVEENGTITRSGDLNLSNNTDMMEFFKDRGDANNAQHVINAMGNKDDASRDMYVIDTEKMTTQYLIENHPDSNAAKNAARAGELNEFLFNHSVDGKHISCYVKRELIPKYRCPLDGLDQTLYGGHPSDDSLSVKRTCDEVCVTPPMGCLGADSGFEEEETFPELDFRWDNTPYHPLHVFTIPVNPNLQMRRILFQIRVFINANVHNWHDTFMAELRMPYRVDYTDVDGFEHTLIQFHPYNLDQRIAEIAIGAIPHAKEVRITVYRPRTNETAPFPLDNIAFLYHTVNLSKFRVEYASDEYFFCSLNQIVTDPNTQCQGGEIYNASGSDGSFKVCVREEGIKGPESRYHGFYSRESCNRACVLRQDCMPTLEHYTYQQVTDPNAYRVTVGCADTPGNADCSPTLCEEMFRSEQMPDQEIVYSPTKAARYTVVAGAELPDARRPKVDLDGEQQAAGSGDYEAVFTDTMKDAAFDNMIKDGTLNYAKNLIGQPTEVQNAYRRAAYRDASPYLPPRIQLQWMVKPRAEDYNGQDYDFYIIAKHEVIYHPISGIFLTDDSYNTAYSSDNAPYFKDEIFSYRRSDGIFEPFYVKEYAWLQENNITDALWKENTQSMEKRYILYDGANDRYNTASPLTQVAAYATRPFDRNRNWEIFMAAQDIASEIMTGTRGMTFVRQESTGPTVLPEKRWIGDPDETAASLGRARFYGFFSHGGGITAQQIVEALEEEGDGAGYLFYDTDRYRSLPDEIAGDGAMPTSPVKLFQKGPPDNRLVSIELNPRAQDEGKQAVMFMFLYKDNE